VTDIRLDYGALEGARAEVESVISTLDRAGSMGADIAGLVGYPQLASTVTTFADGWDINRSRLTEELAAISDSLQAIVDAFTDLDRQMADATEDEG
jgi:uncharacterized protein YukE